MVKTLHAEFLGLYYHFHTKPMEGLIQKTKQTEFYMENITINHSSIDFNNSDMTSSSSLWTFCIDT